MTDETELPRCEICGEPMPEGETMFKFHGFSGPCPAPPLPRPAAINWQTSYERALARIAELEAARADAERYRWLRDRWFMPFSALPWCGPDGYTGDLNDAIDAARKERT